MRKSSHPYEAADILRDMTRRIMARYASRVKTRHVVRISWALEFPSEGTRSRQVWTKNFSVAIVIFLSVESEDITILCACGAQERWRSMKTDSPSWSVELHVVVMAPPTNKMRLNPFVSHTQVRSPPHLAFSMLWATRSAGPC